MWRPLLNLKPLNKFIRLKRFRMDTLRTILSSILTPAWAVSLDLKGAYMYGVKLFRVESLVYHHGTDISSTR